MAATWWLRRVFAFAYRLQLCYDEFPNPENDLASFDDFPKASILMLKLVTMDGWVAPLMTPLLEAEPEIKSIGWLFFVLTIFIMAYILTGLFVAVLTNK